MTIPVGGIPRIEFGEDFFRQIRVLETIIDMLQAKLSDFHDPLGVVLETVAIPSVETNFAVGGRPRWQPLAPSTVNTRGAAGPILYRTGKLYSAATDPTNWVVTRDMLALTNLSAAPYADYHQLGAPRANIPARPFVEWQEQDIAEIQEIFSAWVGFLADEIWGFGGL